MKEDARKLLRYTALKSNPDLWAREAAGIDELDPWQRKFFLSTAKRRIAACSRQAGKSEIVSLLVSHRLVFRANELILLISPSLRQSQLLYGRIKKCWQNAGQQFVPSVKETQLQLHLANGSSCYALPSKGGETIRGFSAVSLVVMEEASRLADAQEIDGPDIYAAIRPFLAVSHGDLIMISTPALFADPIFSATWFSENEEWERFRVTADDVPRISKSHLADEKAALGEMRFMTEYYVSFNVGRQASFFDESEIMKSFDDSVLPLE